MRTGPFRPLLMNVMGIMHRFAPLSKSHPQIQHKDGLYPDGSGVFKEDSPPPHRMAQGLAETVWYEDDGKSHAMVLAVTPVSTQTSNQGRFCASKHQMSEYLWKREFTASLHASNEAARYSVAGLKWLNTLLRHSAFFITFILTLTRSRAQS